MRETERQFQQAVEDLARALRWRVYHTYDSRRSAPGFPDLVLARQDEPIIFAELKTDKGRVSPAQAEWLAALEDTASDVEVHVWRPSEWSAIERRLR
jgi:hypothetical protein